MLERGARQLFREAERQRQSTYSRSPGPAVGVLLTYAQPSPPSCPHKEAVMGVCRHRKRRSRKQTAIRMSEEEEKGRVTSAVTLQPYGSGNNQLKKYPQLKK